MTMRVADTYVGKRSDEAVAARLAREGFETITVDEAERRRSRFRTQTEAGTALGVTVGRELTAGDVLAAEDLLVVVELEPVEAMVVDLGDAGGSLTGAVALGHAVGNRHWDLVVEGVRAYVPVVEDRERMARAVDPLLPDGVTVDYVSVSPALFDGTTPDHGSSGTDSRRGEHAHAHDADGHGVQSGVAERGDES